MLFALEKFMSDESAYDVAVLDIMMPELDGLTVCKELRKAFFGFRYHYAQCKDTGNGQGDRFAFRCG